MSFYILHMCGAQKLGYVVGGVSGWVSRPRAFSGLPALTELLAYSSAPYIVAVLSFPVLHKTQSLSNAEEIDNTPTNFWRKEGETV